MLAMLVGGWYYMQNLDPTFKVESDANAYFTTSHPKVTLKLENSQDAQSGTMTVSYDKAFVIIEEIKNSEGVTHRELEDTLIFDLSTEYFASKNNVISELQLKGTGKSGETSFIVDDKQSSLIDVRQISLDFVVQNKTVSIGVMPDRGNNPVGDINSL